MGLELSDKVEMSRPLLGGTIQEISITGSPTNVLISGAEFHVPAQIIYYRVHPSS
jgi:hypothetical protein